MASPTPEMIHFARAALAAAFTGLPQILAKAVAASSSAAVGAAGKVSTTIVNRGVATVAGMGRMLAARFVATLGPLAVFAQTLQASNSGMSVLGKSVQVLAATLAPVLLPVAVALAAAILELADNLDTELKPAITEWTRLIIGMKPALLDFARALAHTIGWLTNPGGKTSEATAAKTEGEAARAVANRKSREQFERDVEELEEIRFLRGARMNETAEGRKAAYLLKYDELKRTQAAPPGSPDPALDFFRRTYKPGMKGYEYESAIQAAPDVSQLRGLITSGAVSGADAEKVRTAIDKLAADRLSVFLQNHAGTLDKREFADVRAASVKAEKDARDLLQRFTPGGAAPRDASAAALPDGGAGAIPAGSVAPSAKPAPGAGSGDGWLDRRVSGFGGKPGDTGPAGRGRPGAGTTRDVLSDVMASLRLSIMPQASIGSLEGVGRQVQLKALQSDPLDARLLDITTKSVERLDSIIGELKGLRGDMTAPAKKGPTALPHTMDGSKPK